MWIFSDEGELGSLSFTIKPMRPSGGAGACGASDAGACGAGCGGRGGGVGEEPLALEGGGFWRGAEVRRWVFSGFSKKRWHEI